MRILAIDPGTYDSAALVYDTDAHKVLHHDHLENEHLLLEIPEMTVDKIICEGIQSYGMAVGQSTFDTCIWIGRFWQAARCPFELFYRKEVKLRLCGSSRAKDGNVRQACIDAFEPTGGGKNPQVGTKNQPGPLYGVSKHIWSALAIALAWTQRMKEEEFNKRRED